jgi:cleavage and polyadenylation specificity factor subunit 1
MGNTELKYPMYSDIYGISKTTTTPTKDGSTNNGTQPAAKKTKTKSVIHLSLRDSLPAYGPIASMTFSLAKNGVSPFSISITVVVPLLTNRQISFQDRPVPELVAATGSGISGGFTLFQVLFHSLALFRCRLNSWNLYQRDLPVIAKRKLHIIGGARGLWSLPIRQPVRASGISYEKPMNPFHAEMDTLIMSTDINPSPGFSRVRFTGFNFSSFLLFLDLSTNVCCYSRFRFLSVIFFIVDFV